jgi:hypothetical protein
VKVYSEEELQEMREPAPEEFAELMRREYRLEEYSFPAFPLPTAQSRALEEHGVNLYYP